MLYRHDTINFDKGDALVFENYPGAPRGGKQHVVNFIKKGFLPSRPKYLSGQHVIAWSDVNDNNVRNADERDAVPGTPARRAVPLQAVLPTRRRCAREAYICTWNPATADSWRTNRKADVTQGFYFDNIYHNYLERAPFGFTAAAGNFKRRRPGAAELARRCQHRRGFPDGDHIDNANMSTPPDGIPPTMQMYLFDLPGAWRCPASSRRWTRASSCTSTRTASRTGWSSTPRATRR